MKKQVDVSHYNFGQYAHKRRWASMWYQLDEVIKLAPKRVLEIGPGAGLFKVAAGVFGINVETLDIDPDLHPDYVASVFAMPFKDGEFDAVCAFQMLEHLPFEESLDVFQEMCRVSNRAVVISLPDVALRWTLIAQLPPITELRLSIPRPRLGAKKHTFDGEHYWEINKKGFPLRYVHQALSRRAGTFNSRSFLVPENTYHRFFIFEKKT